MEVDGKDGEESLTEAHEARLSFPTKNPACASTDPHPDGASPEKKPRLDEFLKEFEKQIKHVNKIYH